MTTTHPTEDPIKPTDLRGILKYVPMFRDQTFVIALDGGLVAHENLQNVLLDVAVLRSLQIKIILVHGIGRQLTELSAQRNIPVSDPHGEGKTDPETLQLGVEASALVSHDLMRGLARNGLRCALTNGIRSKEIGIVKGEDQLASGKVDKLDTVLFHRLLEAQTMPVATPVAFARDGAPLRLNSDHLAAELASRLSASKLIYMTTQDGIQLDGRPLTNLPVEELEALLSQDASRIPERLRSKARHAVKAVRGNTPRAHILDGRLFGALLNEVFDKVGIGTMVYSNEYQSIRRADTADAHALYNITRQGVDEESLRPRSRAEIEAAIDQFLVYEIDGSIVGCLLLENYENGKVVEIGSVYVQPFYQNKGVGRRLVEFACSEAKSNGAERVFAMTTQAANFFLHIAGFEEGDTDVLPVDRREKARSDGRNSRVFHRLL